MRWFLFILFVLGVTAFLTNPDEEDLRGVLAQFVGAKVDAKVDQLAPPVVGMPGPLGEFRERARETLKSGAMASIGIRRDNFGLFSIFHLDVPPVPMEKEPPQCVIGVFKVIFIPLAKC